MGFLHITPAHEADLEGLFSAYWLTRCSRVTCQVEAGQQVQVVQLVWSEQAVHVLFSFLLYSLQSSVHCMYQEALMLVDWTFAKARLRCAGLRRGLLGSNM